MKNRNLSDMLKKTSIIFTVIIMFMMSIGLRNISYADEEIEEWEESGTVLLDKVSYSRKKKTLTVEITETSGELAHEYELYMLVEGELPDAIGRYLNLGKILSILGIMTVDTSDTVRIIVSSGGKITIKDQEIYFGNNEEVKEGQKVLIGVESLDENYNSSKSNLIELEIGEDYTEQSAITTQNGGGNNQSSNTQNGSSSSGGNPLLIIIGGVMVAVGAALMLFTKKRTSSQTSQKADTTVIEKTKKEVKEEKSETEEESERLFPSLSDKTVIFTSKDEELLNNLKKRPFLEVVQCEKEDIEETAEENEPDLLISDIDTSQDLDDLLELKKEKLEKVPVALIINDEIYPEIRERLEQLQKDKIILCYSPASASLNRKIVRFILPIIKPELKSDASLENLGKIATLLGFPAVAAIINLYVSGRDIKSILEEKEFGFSENAALISDIASILGFDKVAGVAGLVGDIEAIRDALDKDAGANEYKNGAIGVHDIIEVARDLKDR